jgi:glycerol uptake facilitator-like aquaporin
MDEGPRMDMRLLHAYLVELVGTFGFVFVAAGLACVSVTTTPAEAMPGSAPLTGHQPGLLGVALGQSLVWMALVAWSAPLSGGYLNPAIALMRWVFGRLSSVRLAWFIGAQMMGGVLAAFALKLIFEPRILHTAHYGAPYLNPLVFTVPSQGAIWAGLAIELLLTFFFVLAMFARVEQTPSPWLSAAVMAGAALFAGPLTGAALNPARWFGPAFWEMVDHDANRAIRETLVYVAGPILGALLAAAFASRVTPRDGAERLGP